jgi:hypothetical protein
VPVFFLIAFALGEGLYSLLGYKPENADAPVWALLVVDIPVLLVVLIPCAAAVVFGRRSSQMGDRRGRLPLIIGVAAGVGWLVLTIVSEVGNIVRT